MKTSPGKGSGESVYGSVPLPTAEELTLLSHADLGIAQPAPMKQFEGLDDFIESSNNFYIHFTDNRAAVRTYRTHKVFQRFSLLYPDQEILLTDRLRDQQDWEGFDSNTWQALLDAYRVMSGLVDVNDPNVTKNDETDSFYLIR